MIKYISIDKDGYVADCINYPYGDYVAVDVMNCPATVTNGCYSLVDCTFELDKKKYRDLYETQQQFNKMDEFLLKVMEEGIEPGKEQFSEYEESYLKGIVSGLTGGANE